LVRSLSVAAAERESWRTVLLIVLSLAAIAAVTLVLVARR
jgi:hypothetical protein